MSEPDYKALRATRFGAMDRETQRQRRTESNRRTSVAQQRALSILGRLHPEDYRSLYLQALAEVNEERGPLPGDPETNGA